MCFSATASFVAGGVLGTTGVLTLKQAKSKRELPIATIPLLFGIQQTIEGVVWISFNSPLLNMISTYAYSVFSHVLWPIFIPFAILLIEKDSTRKKFLGLFCLVGLAVGIYLFYFITTETVTARIFNNSIDYNSPHLYVPIVISLYLIATCGSGFVSSRKTINKFSIVALTSFFIASWFFTVTFISVWCFFAAILSASIYWYIKTQPDAKRRDGQKLKA